MGAERGWETCHGHTATLLDQGRPGSLPDVLMYKPSYHFQAQSLKLLKQTAKGPQVFKSPPALVSLLVSAGGTQATPRHTPHLGPPQPGRRCLLQPGQTSCSRDGLAQPNCCCTQGPEGPSRTFQQAACKTKPRAQTGQSTLPPQQAKSTRHCWEAWPEPQDGHILRTPGLMPLPGTREAPQAP